MVVTPDTCRAGHSEPESDLSRHCVLDLLPRGCCADLSSNPDSITYCLCDVTSRGLSFQVKRVGSTSRAAPGAQSVLVLLQEPEEGPPQVTTNRGLQTQRPVLLRFQGPESRAARPCSRRSLKGSLLPASQLGGPGCS